MLSNGGVAGARIVLLPDPLCDKPTCKFPGISKVNNFEFSSDGVKVWRAYQVGEGKQFSWSQFEGKKKTQVIRSVTFCTVNISVLAVLDFKLKSGKNM